MVTPFAVVWISPGSVAAQLPPASAARSTTMLPAFMLSTIGWVTMIGALRPMTRAVVTMMSFFDERPSSCSASASAWTQLLLAGLQVQVGSNFVRYFSAFGSDL